MINVLLRHPRRRRLVMGVRTGRLVWTAARVGGQQSYGLRSGDRYRICNWVRRLRRLSIPRWTRLRPSLHVI